jgi:hypothetical protein
VRDERKRPWRLVCLGCRLAWTPCGSRYYSTPEAAEKRRSELFPCRTRPDVVPHLEHFENGRWVPAVIGGS